MSYTRLCSKPGCANPAVATMTFDHAEATAILGPLATKADPIGYDLCQKHAERLSVPRGWQVVRLADSFTPPVPNDEQLMALPNAVRAASRTDSPCQQLSPGHYTGSTDRDSNPAQPQTPGTRRGHLTLVDSPKRVS